MLASGKAILTHILTCGVTAVNIVIPCIPGIGPGFKNRVVRAAAVIGSGRAIVVERVQNRRISPIRNIRAAVPSGILNLLPGAGAGGAGAFL